MPDNSTLTIPSGAISAYINAITGMPNSYSALVALGTYGVLATFTYGGLMSLQPSVGNALVIIPTGTATVYASLST